jgi:hypothetical protein
MKLILTKYFKSKKSAVKTLIFGYFIGSFTLWMGLSFHHEYRKYGYFTDHHDRIRIYGNDALISSLGIIIAASIILAFTLYATVIALYFVRRTDFTKLPTKPEVLICDKCQNPIDSKKVSGIVCPTCGGNLEDIKGYYGRHPELKETCEPL